MISNSKFLGIGSIGNTFQKQDEETHQLYVIKNVDPNFFKTDLKTLSESFIALSFPTLGKVLKITEGTITSQFFTGYSLDKLFSQNYSVINKYLNPTNMTTTIIGLVAGLQYLYQNNLTHLRLYPTNIFFDIYKNDQISKNDVNSNRQHEDSDFFELKITDFGFGYHVSKSNNYLISSDFITFISPEYILSKNDSKDYSIASNTVFDEKCDVYSFGKVLWALFSRSLPPNPSNRFSYIALNEQIPDFPADAPVFYRNLYYKCCSYDPNVRPSFAQILGLFFQNESANKFLLSDAEEIKIRQYINSIKKFDLKTAEITKTTDVENMISENDQPLQLNNGKIPDDPFSKRFLYAEWAVEFGNHKAKSYIDDVNRRYKKDKSKIKTISENNFSSEHEQTSQNHCDSQTFSQLIQQKLPKQKKTQTRQKRMQQQDKIQQQLFFQQQEKFQQQLFLQNQEKIKQQLFYQQHEKIPRLQLLQPPQKSQELSSTKCNQQQWKIYTQIQEKIKENLHTNPDNYFCPSIFDDDVPEPRFEALHELSRTNDPKAIYCLSTLYNSYGNFIPTKRNYHMQRASRMNFPPARYAVSIIMLSEFEDEIPTVEKTIFSLKKAADAGNYDAILLLAKMAFFGLVKNIDIPTIIRYYEKVFANSFYTRDIEFYKIISTVYSKKRVSPTTVKNYALAVYSQPNLPIDAIREGVLEGNDELAVFFGYMLNVNNKEFTDLLRKVAVIYQNPKNIVKLYEQENDLSLLLIGANLGNPECCFYIGSCFMKNDISLAIRAFSVGLINIEPNSIMNLVACFENAVLNDHSNFAKLKDKISALSKIDSKSLNCFKY